MKITQAPGSEEAGTNNNGEKVYQADMAKGGESERFKSMQITMHEIPMDNFPKQRMMDLMQMFDTSTEEGQFKTYDAVWDWHETQCKAREAEAIMKVLKEVEFAGSIAGGQYFNKPKQVQQTVSGSMLSKIAELRARYGEKV